MFSFSFRCAALLLFIAFLKFLRRSAIITFITTEARFHYVVERPALRAGSASSSSVPDEMKSWVGTATGVPEAEAAKV